MCVASNQTRITEAQRYVGRVGTLIEAGSKQGTWVVEFSVYDENGKLAQERSEFDVGANGRYMLAYFDERVPEDLCRYVCMCECMCLQVHTYMRYVEVCARVGGITRVFR